MSVISSSYMHAIFKFVIHMGFSLLITHKADTFLCTVNNVYQDNFLGLNICSIDFQPMHWKEQKIFSGGKTTEHKPAQLTKVLLERVLKSAKSIPAYVCDLKIHNHGCAIVFHLIRRQCSSNGMNINQ